MPNTRSLRVTVLVAIGFGLLQIASVAGQQSEEGLGIKIVSGAPAAPQAEIKYRKQWAVVVGIDYRREDRVGAADSLPPLSHAELDARAVHGLLGKSFDFPANQATLLTGSGATKSRILETIGELANNREVAADDCVLVYFSGHGMLRRASADNVPRGYLLPIDVKWTESQTNVGTAINMSEIVDLLKSGCAARHKLLILDCCHSGAVFFRLEGTPSGKFDHEQMGMDVFSAAGFQAITASRDNQKASDGRNGHSPFTNALLESLQTLPLRNERAWGNRYFTASQLFTTMKPCLDGEAYSDPQCRWLTSDQGEFHFIPSATADFRETELDEMDRKSLLALTPTTFGNWWPYEVPWFMPGLRLAILDQSDPPRSPIEELNRETLEIAARLAQAQAKESRQSADPAFQMRYEHLDALLAAGEGERQKDVIKRIVFELKEKATHAEDVHYLAVLLHLLGDYQEAGKNYDAALKKYAALPKAPLAALCLLDAGVFSQSQNDTETARARFRAALRTFAGRAPKPFQVFALCREAEVYRREGKFGSSRSRMNEAVNLLVRWDATESTLLSANTMNARAWSHMESWDFKRAKPDFEAAQGILKNVSRSSRFESTIDRFHVQHGLAMIERYQGRSHQALADYRQLTQNISKELRDLENLLDDDLPKNYLEIRSLLLGRLVNSLERQADCSLFGEPADFAEAADDYRRALNECRSLPEDRRNTEQVDLLYRRAVALCLQVISHSSSAETLAGEAAEILLARELCGEAEKLLGESRQLARMKGLPLKTRLAQYLALACLHVFEDSEIRADPLAVLPELAMDANRFDRDELERLMFLYKVTIDHRKLFHLAPYQCLQHIGQLLSLCRSACRLEFPDPELLAYLRPYYNSAFLAQTELMPGNSKELIEIAWEATHGTPYMKLGKIQPLVVLYHAAGKSYLLLDTPGGTNRAFLLNEAPTPEHLIAASTSQEPITLPDEMRALLTEIQRRPSAPVLAIRWRDPVLGIGYAAPLQPALPRDAPAGAMVRVVHKLDSDLQPDPQSEFPFHLRGILKPNQFEEDRSGLGFRRSPLPTFAPKQVDQEVSLNR